MTRLRMAAAALALCCARMASPPAAEDGGSFQPTVEDVDPPPGTADAGARFTVRFSAAMDEGQLLAASGRSESVALAAAADVERAAAAIEHAPLSAHERTLLIPAAAEVSSDRRSITLSPDAPLPPGGYALLVSPRLKDEAGRKLAGNGMRFAFTVGAKAAAATLISPPPGGEVPSNLTVVRAQAVEGRVSLLGPRGEEIAAAEAHGVVALAIASPLRPGAGYALAVGGTAVPGQIFSAASCVRSAAPALQGGMANLLVRDTGVTVQVVLDWPAQIEATVEDGRGAAITARAEAVCAPAPCGPQTFACPAATRIEGLVPASDYALRITARDDYGFTLQAAPQPFSTIAPLPRVLISEVMASGVEGEYAELLNVGPGAADLESLALQGVDGAVRPLLGGAPPLPLLLPPGARALAVGASFDATLYRLPPGTPVLRASTQRLLGRGLSDDAPPWFALIALGDVPVEVSAFPAPSLRCPSEASLQRDESVPPEDDAPWTCGVVSGTPGRPP